MYNPSLRREKELLSCEDGSYTLYSKEFDEAYHSTKDGALYESLHKHVIPALFYKREHETITILDICFGLGYNTLATLYYSKKQQLTSKIHIIAPEFDEDLVRSLKSFQFPSEFDNLKEIIEVLSEKLYYEDEQFKIEILVGDARESIPHIQEKIDIIYQDAFSPTHNPLLWTYEWFQDLYKISKQDALLTTYSTAASIRLGLYEQGFLIYIHRAEKMRFSTIASLTPLDELEFVDMELKKLRNPTARSMKDKDYI